MMEWFLQSHGPRFVQKWGYVVETADLEYKWGKHNLINYFLWHPSTAISAGIKEGMNMMVYDGI